MTVSENRQGIVLLPSHLLPLLPSFPRSDGQLISDRVMGITTVLQKMGGQAGEARGKEGFDPRFSLERRLLAG